MPFCMKYTCLLLLLLQFYVIHAAYPTSCHQPTRTVNPPGSQSRWSFSHLPIMQASWRWNGSVKEGINWIWAPRPSTPCCLSISPHETDESEGKSCVALQRRNFSPHPIWPPSPHIVSFKELLFPLLSRNHLGGVVVSDCKSSKAKAFLPRLWRQISSWTTRRIKAKLRQRE